MIVARCPRFVQHAIHEARQKLHRDVFEGERRPVEQLEDPTVGPDLHQRRHRRMTEAPRRLRWPCGQTLSREIDPPMNG